MDGLASLELLDLLVNCCEPHVVVSSSKVLWKNHSAQNIELNDYDLKRIYQKLQDVKSASLSLSDCRTWQATRTSGNYIVLRGQDSFETLDEILRRTDWPMSDMILDHPWEKTRFGCLRGWSKPLRDAVVQCLASKWSVCLWIKPEQNFLQDTSHWPKEDPVDSYYAIYNEGYIRVLGCHHPTALGVSMNGESAVSEQHRSPHAHAWDNLRDLG